LDFLRQYISSIPKIVNTKFKLNEFTIVEWDSNSKIKFEYILSLV